MMNLAIVYAHVQKEAALEVLLVGNLPSQSVGILVARFYVNVRSITLRSNSFLVFGFGPSAIGTCLRHAYDRVVMAVVTIRAPITIVYYSESMKKVCRV